LFSNLERKRGGKGGQKITKRKVFDFSVVYAPYILKEGEMEEREGEGEVN